MEASKTSNELGSVYQEQGGSFAAPLFILWILSTLGLWFFAFYHLPPGTPDWVARAQAACFGTNESGLPNAGGWLLLIASPLTLLIGLMFLFGSEFSSGIASFVRTRIGFFLALIVAVVSATEISWIAFRLRDSFGLSENVFDISGPESFPPSYPKMMVPLPEYTLTNQQGEPIKTNSTNGKTMIISFVFAHCSTVCPALVGKVNEAISSLPPFDYQAMLITLDPWRDKPSALPDMATRWKLPSNVDILSGEPSVVEQSLDAFNVPRQRDTKTGEVNHPALIYIADRSGKIIYGLNNPSVQWIREAASKVASDPIK